MSSSFTLKGKKILVYDYGIFLPHALALARDGAEVKYYIPWDSAFPKFSVYAPGIGYEKEGLSKEFYFWPWVTWADLIFMPDVGSGAEAEFIRKHFPNTPVFGSALDYEGGNRLEQDRWFMRQLQKKIGLPTQPTDLVQGVPKLREYLQKNDNKFVKINKFRGDLESFQAKNYDAVELILDEVEVLMGPFNETYEFVVEGFVEGIEPGFDCFFNGTDWIKPYLWGIEQSKSCYVGKFVTQLPKPLQLIADKLKPVLAKIDYRGAVSIECRITKDGTPYLIDVCMRYPAPLSTAYPLAIKNYSEVIYKVAKGESVTLEPTNTYFSMAPLSTPYAKKHFVKLDFDEKYSKYIKPYVSAKLQDKFFGVKEHETVFCLCVSGNDWHKLIPAIEALAKKVDAYGLDLDVISGLHRIEEVVREYKDYGMGEF